MDKVNFSDISKEQALFFLSQDHNILESIGDSAALNIWKSLKSDPDEQKKYFDIFYKTICEKHNEENGERRLDYFALGQLIANSCSEVQERYFGYIIDPLFAGMTYENVEDRVNYLQYYILNKMDVSVIDSKLSELLSKVKENSYDTMNISMIEQLSVLLKCIPDDIKEKHLDEICDTFLTEEQNISSFADNLSEEIANKHFLDIAKRIETIYIAKKVTNPYISYVGLYDKDGRIDISNMQSIFNILHRWATKVQFEDFLKTYVSQSEEFTQSLATSLQKAIDEEKLKPHEIVLYMLAIGNTDVGRKIINTNCELLMRAIPTPIEAIKIMGEEFANNQSVRDVINDRFDDVIAEMLGSSDERQDKIKEMLKLIVKDVLKNEGMETADIRYVGEGGYSRVFSVGDKIIKTGQKTPESPKLPRNCRRFIQPIFRHDFEVPDDTRQKVHIEVEEKVDTNSEISEEEMYQVWKDIRNQGMVWTDVKPSNLGRLKKDNKIYFYGIKENEAGEKHVHGENLGLEEDNDIEILKAGEVVLIDLDYVFPCEVNGNPLYRSKIIVPRFGGDLFSKFERRYNFEKCEEQKTKRSKLNKPMADFEEI